MSKVSPTATSRLRTDYMRLKRDPVPYVFAEPLPSNIVEWHYVVQGPPGSLYVGGYYHGKLVFPPEYPFRPPSIYMITPSGRFKTNTRLCLSISDFHPDTWNPAWSVSTILTGLLSFMLETSPTFGSMETSSATKRRLAEESLSFNLKDKTFCELFPEMQHEIKNRLQELSVVSEIASKNGTSNDSSRGNSGSFQDQAVSTNLSTALVILGFAVFAWACKYFIENVIEDGR